ncbi:hypothetical protein MMC24_005579 [Lignoscripta atroalba]|nr:hypothetical protein [Lignoscripta atroalba]
MPTYVITGANRGLGLEFVRQLSSSPDNTIIACSRSLSSDLSDLKSLQSQSKSTIHILECDTSSLSSIQSFGKEVTKTLGSDDAQIDYLLNNAGINSVSEQTSLNIGPEDLVREVGVNVVGPAKTVEALLPHLRKGSVVMNMTSGLGSCESAKGMQPTKCTTYSISKAALNMLTVHQAFDLGIEGEGKRGVRVICMDPGWVKTRMGGEGAVLEPEESIGGMLKCLHGLKESDTAKFYTYTGKEVPW